jgi:hypothetical protein
LGANEPFLASLRAATGGKVIATPLDPWRHDLTATDRFTELWPLLLVLALLLWPLDIALRRMSLGRRELVAARGWVDGIGRRRRAAGPRTATAEGMLAASGRVRTSDARAAMRTAPGSPVSPESPPTAERVASKRPDTPAKAPASAKTASAQAVASQPTPATPVVPSTGDIAPPPAEAPDTMSRLRDAKRRARDR